MVLFPKSGFGRFLLGLIVLSTLSYLVLNLVSFGGTPWISYDLLSIRFGLWRVCDTSAVGLCNQWSDNTFKSNTTAILFGTSKPTFIRTSQALEIISLIFYIIAAILIILGILNLDGLPYHTMFIAAIILLFISIIFLSATLGVMSVQGRNNILFATLVWAWWNGLVGLIMTIVTFVALIILLIDLRFSKTNQTHASQQNKSKQNKSWATQSTTAYGMNNTGQLPVLSANTHALQPYHYSQQQQQQQQQYPNSQQQYPQENYSNHHQQQQQHYYPDPNQYSQQQQQQQYYPNNYNQDAMMSYGDQSPAEQYFHNSTPSPIVSALARQYVTNAADNQYQNHLLDPYQQYLQNPYMVNNYF